MTSRHILIETVARWLARNRNCFEIENWNMEIGQATEGKIITKDEQSYYDNMSDKAWKRFRNEVQHKAISNYQLNQMLK